MKYFRKLNIYLFSFLMSFSLFSQEASAIFIEAGEMLGYALVAKKIEGWKKEEQVRKQGNLIKRGNLPPVLKALAELAGSTVPPADEEIETVKELIQNNPSDARITDPDVLVYGKTALYLATEIGNPDIIRELIKHGAGKTINIKSELEGPESLHPISIQRMNEVFGSGTIDIKSEREGFTPLHIASWSGNTEALGILLSVGEVNINARDELRRTPLIVALQQGNFKTVKLLVKQGANINTKDGSSGWTPLYYALFGQPQNLEIAKFLIANGANMDGSIEKISGYKAVVNFLREIQRENPGNQELSLRIEQKIKDVTPLVNKCINAIMGR